MKYYVVSDIHGYCTQLVSALEESGFFKENKPCRLVVCGDVLDRGKEAIKTVELLLKLHEENKLIFILGNHEDLFVRCLDDISHGEVFEIASGTSYHYRNKTWHSILQLTGMNTREAMEYPGRLVALAKQSTFYKKLLPLGVNYFETPNYIFTHGWIPVRTEEKVYSTRYSYDPDWRRASDAEWERARWRCGIDFACKHKITERGKTIVCGHWHASYGHAVFEDGGREEDDSPFYSNGIIAIDGATAVSGRVNCIVLEDQP